MNEPNYDYLFKILMIGDAAVGKSSVLLKYTDNTFQDSYMSTIGVDFKIKGTIVDNKTVKLQIWDTAGQERFKTITSTYYRGSQGIILMFDLTDLNSFKNLDVWIKEIQTNSENEALKLLIGNKSDLGSKRQIDYDTANSFANQQGMRYFETSAKNGQNVEEIFSILAREIKNSVVGAPPKDLAKDTKSLKDSKDSSSVLEKEKKKGCC